MPNTPEHSFVIILAVLVISLASYIRVALKLSPVKAMIFGGASIPAAFLAGYAVQYTAITAGFENSFGFWDYVMWWWVIGILWPSGLVAFAIGFVRFAVQLWRSRSYRRALPQN